MSVCVCNAKFQQLFPFPQFYYCAMGKGLTEFFVTTAGGTQEGTRGLKGYIMPWRGTVAIHRI